MHTCEGYTFLQIHVAAAADHSRSDCPNASAAAVARLAPAQGFGAVMLYGGVAASLFAVAGWLVFGAGREGAPRAGRL